MAERLTADELVARLDVTSDDLEAFRKAGLKAVRTKSGDRFGWPASLHWYVRYREQAARQQLPDVVTQRQFAQLVGKVDKTVFNWRRSGMPSVVNPADSRRPLIPLADSVRWLVARSEAQTEKGQDPADLVKIEREHVALERDRIRLERERKTVVDVEFMKREFEELVHATIATLEGLPGRLADELAPLTEPAAVRQRIEREIAPTRDQWADAVVQVVERTADVLIGAEDEEAAVSAVPSGTAAGETDEDAE